MENKRKLEYSDLEMQLATTKDWPKKPVKIMGNPSPWGIVNKDDQESG